MLNFLKCLQIWGKENKGLRPLQEGKIQTFQDREPIHLYFIFKVYDPVHPKSLNKIQYHKKEGTIEMYHFLCCCWNNILPDKSAFFPCCS